MRYLADRLAEALQRGHDYEQAAELGEAEATRRVFDELMSGPSADATVKRVREEFGGPGYALSVTSRFAPEWSPARPPDIVAVTWQSGLEEGRVSVSATVEAAIEYSKGLAIVVRTLEYAAESKEMWAGDGFSVSVRWHVHWRGLDTCRLLLDGFLAPGRLLTTADDLARYEPGASGTVNEELTSTEGSFDPVARREECRSLAGHEAT